MYVVQMCQYFIEKKADYSISFQSTWTMRKVSSYNETEKIDPRCNAINEVECVLIGQKRYLHHMVLITYQLYSLPNSWEAIHRRTRYFHFWEQCCKSLTDTPWTWAKHGLFLKINITGHVYFFILSFFGKTRF